LIDSVQIMRASIMP